MRIVFTKLKTSKEFITVDFGDGNGPQKYAVEDARQNGIQIPASCPDFSKIGIQGSTAVFNNAEAVEGVKIDFGSNYSMPVSPEVISLYAQIEQYDTGYDHADYQIRSNESITEHLLLDNEYDISYGYTIPVEYNKTEEKSYYIEYGSSQYATVSEDFETSVEIYRDGSELKAKLLHGYIEGEDIFDVNSYSDELFIGNIEAQASDYGYITSNIYNLSLGSYTMEFDVDINELDGYDGQYRLILNTGYYDLTPEMISDNDDGSKHIIIKETPEYLLYDKFIIPKNLSLDASLNEKVEETEQYSYNGVDYDSESDALNAFITDFGSDHYFYYNGEKTCFKLSL